MIKSLSVNNYAAGTPGICLVAVIPIRKAPQEESEMISQLLFGEFYVIEEIVNNWLKIRTFLDIYTGWIDSKFFRKAEWEEGQDSHKNQTVLYGKLAEIDMPDGTSQLITAGSSLYFYDPDTHEFMIGEQKYRIRPISGEILLPSQKIQESAWQFMNTPYLWGGRSVFGADCSGFIQTLFKIHGVSFPRDTSPQASAGQEVTALNDALPGDLAFFSNGEGEINHVGMIMADSRIIHCSGWVRIDRLDETGIFSLERGIHTHRLFGVRRVETVDPVGIYYR